jgi:soluble lytic murein transglycosylase-like protein
MPGLAPRRGGDRRYHDRRQHGRPGGERRRRDRRGAAGGLLLTSLALAGALHSARGTSKIETPAAPVSASPSPAPDPADAPAAPEGEAPAPELDAIIQEAAAKYGVSSNLVRAVIQTESRFDPRARSAAGAEGLMQLMPRLARQLEVKNPFDPRENVFAGVKYLSELLERHRGNVGLALASYNAGPRNVRRFRGIPPFKETRGYVKKIKGLLAEAREAQAAGDTRAD